ncbi:MAG: zinc metallopeptidase [Nitrososphaerales archaeon]
MFFLDPMYFVLIMPAIILSIWAQAKVNAAFSRYSRIPSSLSGADVARALLDAEGLNNVPVETSSGMLSDHYDPRKRVLRLSPNVYRGYSLAALGVAAHEVGHAVQHKNGYFPLKLRSGLVPVAMFGANFGPMLIFLGIIFWAWAGSTFGSFLVKLGILAFSAAVIFQVITLPVEINASRRALSLLQRMGFASPSQQKAFKDVLTAAALTYLAATLAAILQLIYFLTLSSRRD